MQTFKATFGRWVLPLLGVYMFLVGLETLGIWAAPAILMGILAILIGVLLVITT
jgi:hypothetical protein